MNPQPILENKKIFCIQSMLKYFIHGCFVSFPGKCHFGVHNCQEITVSSLDFSYLCFTWTIIAFTENRSSTSAKTVPQFSTTVS